MSEPIPNVSPDVPPLKWRALLGLLHRLPQGALSRGFGAIADTPLPRAIRPAAIGMFARLLNINAAEAALPIAEYPTLNAFFVRQLRSGTRAWPADPLTAGSPVDAITGQLGRVSAGTLVQAKGRSYTVARLLDDAEEATRFHDGSFLTLYLSPRHYHRIHTPTPGSIAKARHIPGQLLPVNAAAVLSVPELFAVNERLICYVDGALGRIAVVAVGAYNVGRISAAFDARLSTNQRGARAETHTYAPAAHIGRGEEIMAFHLGSTVVVLFEPAVQLDARLSVGAEIRLGQPVAHVSKEQRFG